MNAIILAIGDELVLGQTTDTNSAWLSAQLARRGITTKYHQTVADDRAAIADMITHACQADDYVLITGGLGPTDDDLSRQGLADAMGADLVMDEQSLKAIGAFFSSRGRPMAESNMIQAMHPAGSTMIPNSCGTAPGIEAKVNNATVFVMPGVPSEMREMFAQSILPRIDAMREGDHVSKRAIVTTKINTFGQGESTIADQLGDLMDRTRNPIIGTTVSQGIVAVRIRSEFADPAHAHEQLDQSIAAIESELGPIAFGRDNTTLADVLVPLLAERGMTVASAESCTGGLIGKLITDVSGSSDVYRGGWITYSNEMKAAQLGVDMTVLDEHGAVSEPVARAMAEGAMQRAEADCALSTTGIAGPTGARPDKPVGTVWIALAYKKGGQPCSQALRFQLPGNRETVRDRAAKCALQMLRFHLLGVDLNQIGWAKRS